MAARTSVNLGGGEKLVIEISEAGAQAILTSPEVTADLGRRAKAIADACNEESSWGGYDSSSSSEGNRSHANVWSFGKNDSEARAQRLVRNLDKGAS